MKLDTRIARIAAFAVAALIVLPAVAGAQGVMFVKNEKVGIGVSNPTDPLHIKSTTAGAKTLVRLTNNGAPYQLYQDTALGITWGLQPLSNGDFTITKLGTGGAELTVKQNGTVLMGPGNQIRFLLDTVGNLTIDGTLTEGSSRLTKEDFVTLDSREVLQRVRDLEVLEWSYKGQGTRHVGPMAEDFYGAFELGKASTSLAPRDLAGVTLVALQGLQREVEEKDSRIDQLTQELAELRAMVEALSSN